MRIVAIEKNYGNHIVIMAHWSWDVLVKFPSFKSLVNQIWENQDRKYA